MARLTDANRLSICRPDVAADWDYDKNSDAPDQYTVSSNVSKWWICRAEPGHPSFERTIEQRTRRTPMKCPECPVRRPEPKPRTDSDPVSTAHITDANRLTTCRPDVAADWDHELNAPYTPDQFSIASSSREWWWRCPEAQHPSYPAKISFRTRERHPAKCPGCPRRKTPDAYVTDANRLSIQRPHLIPSWNVEANLPLTPALVTIGSAKSVIWNCLDNPEHPPWPAPIADRAGSENREGTGCPKCVLVRTSRPELRLKAELGAFFAVSDEPNRVQAPNGKVYEVDIADHSRRLIVEFDGAGWHGQPGSLNRDAEKSRELRDAGWTVVRVREQPLQPIDPAFDIAVGNSAHPFSIATAVLFHLAMLGLVATAEADAYAKAGVLRAKDLSDAWIRERLGEPTSKAEAPTLEEKWDRMIEALIDFEERHDHCRVPEGNDVHGVDLRTWCYSQRDAFRKGTLSPQRERRLRTIPTWSFDALEKAFLNGYQAYQEVFNWNGTGQRDPDASPEAVHQARRWAKKQRERRGAFLQRGEDIPADQIAALEALPGWSWAVRDSRFEQQLDVLSEYCRRKGTTTVTIRTTDVWEGHAIGSWISNWRTRADRLTDGQAAALESLPGWTWSKNGDRWNARFAELEAFAKQHGHITPSLSRSGTPEAALAKWKHKYRSELRGQDTERARRFKALLERYGEEWS